MCEVDPICTTGVLQNYNLQRSAALFVVTEIRVPKHPENVDFTVRQSQQIMSCYARHKRVSAKSMWRHSLITGSDMPYISSDFEVPDPFASLQTEYMRTKYYREHLWYVCLYAVFIVIEDTQ